MENWKSKIKSVIVIFFIWCFGSFALAHPLDDQLNKLSRTDVILTYLSQGFQHILPLGLDHILFVVCLFLINSKIKPLLYQITVFTVSHTITLGLCMSNIISAPSYIIEPIIALSIVFVALENIITSEVKTTRLFIVFVFGLIHGLGFAGALTELGLPSKKFYHALISFNIGVELGQITIILFLFFLIGKTIAGKPWYRLYFVIPLSLIIALIATYWTLERINF